MSAAFPVGACDTHMHVYDRRYPAAASAVLRPPDAAVVDYRRVQAALGLQRVVVVQPTTYGLDNTCQVDAAASLGDDARIVVVVDDTTPDAELERLDGLGARGARFHMLPGGALPWSVMPATAARIADLGWHVQVQLDGRDLPARLDALLALPCRLVVDHVGRYMPPVPLDHPAFGALLTLLDTGRCWVKLSAPYESTHDGAPRYPAVGALVRALLERFPDRMLWATNWPHPGQAVPPGVDELRDLAHEWLPSSDLRRRVLVDNPAALYGFGAPPRRLAPDQEHR